MSEVKTAEDIAQDYTANAAIVAGKAHTAS